MEKLSATRRRPLNISFLTELACYAHFLLFTYAATSKLLDYQDSLLQMSKSPIITSYAPVLVWLVPALEILLAILLLLSETRMFALYASLALMTMFTAYIISILNFSDIIPCSCGGVLQSFGWKQHLWFNLGFIALATAALSTHPTTEKTRQGEARHKIFQWPKGSGKAENL